LIQDQRPNNRLLVCNWLDWIVALVSLGALTLNLGYGLYEPHEGHFAGVGYEMLLRGDWVTPTLDGSPYLNKPPLLYWLIRLSFELFGSYEWAARLPLALMGWFGVFMAWQWARLLWGAIAGRVAACMLTTALGWFIFSHQLLLDLPLAALQMGAYYCLWRSVAVGRNWAYTAGLYLLLGGCVLLKGPFGLLFPALAIVGLLIQERFLEPSGRSLKVWHQLRLGFGSVLMGAVILPWGVAVEQANPGFLFYFIWNENFKRFADVRWPPDYEVSKVGIWAYLGITLVWSLPWGILLPGVGRSLFRQWLRFSDASYPFQRQGVAILAIAASAPFIFFLLTPSRLLYYGLPALPPLMVLCAGRWAQLSTLEYRLMGLLWGILGVGIGSVSLWLPWIRNLLPAAVLGSDLIRWSLPVTILSGGLWIIGGWSLSKNRPHWGLGAIALGLMGLQIMASFGFGVMQDGRSSKTLMERANQRLGSEVVWVFEGSQELGAAGAMSFYLNRFQPWTSPQSRSLAPSDLPLGWANPPNGQRYRIVLVLTDGGKKRLPPAFPGDRPPYALTRSQLQQLWNQSQPVVFVTDFLRQPGDPHDPPNLNVPSGAGTPLLVIESRRLYGNPAAKQIWQKSG
jgi:4-amino-4-deoxy-L-arabinose transferase-like glycosyltransferase